MHILWVDDDSPPNPKSLGNIRVASVQTCAQAERWLSSSEILPDWILVDPIIPQDGWGEGLIPIPGLAYVSHLHERYGDKVGLAVYGLALTERKREAALRAGASAVFEKTKYSLIDVIQSLKTLRGEISTVEAGPAQSIAEATGYARRFVERARELPFEFSGPPSKEDLRAIHSAKLLLEEDPETRYRSHQVILALDSTDGPSSGLTQRMGVEIDRSNLPQPLWGLNWSSLDASEFESLVFQLLSAIPSLEDVRWLTATNAPDRGRDLSALHMQADPLLGTIRRRLIVQCKHWLRKGISAQEIASAKQTIRLLEPPRVDILAFATSGTFTTSAVDLVEKHNSSSESALRLELWPGSHLAQVMSRYHPKLLESLLTGVRVNGGSRRTRGLKRTPKGAA